MRKTKHPIKPFRSAREELSESQKIARPVLSDQETSDSYRLAFADQDFLLRKDVRAIRLQLELMKPEVMLHEEHIASTIVIFGSARIPERAVAQKKLTLVQEMLSKNPNDEMLQKKVAIAERILAKSYYYD
ncbi:MAG: 3-isopropylmalate dehydrogenase, partial [Gammaproteobacteria bacterium]